MAGAQTPAQHGITLTWNTDSGATVGYNVYSSTTSGGPYTKLTAAPITPLTYSDTTATDGKVHYYVVTAVGGTSSAPIESQFSAQASATAFLVPAPPVIGTATPF